MFGYWVLGTGSRLFHQFALIEMSETDFIYANLSSTQLQRLSVEFARQVRSLAIELQRRPSHERSSIDQLYRSGTSVGANIREAKYAESPKDFVHKLKVAEKELGEFYYWLGLLGSYPSLINKESLMSITTASNSVGRLLSATIVAMKKKHGL